MQYLLHTRILTVVSLALRRALLGLGVAVVLADGPIVTLALPQLLADLGTTVVGVAAILFVYMAVLAVAVLAAGARRRAPDRRRLALWGFATVALAGVICALAGSLELLLAGRALSAAGGGAALVGAFALLDGGREGRRLWLLASVVGVAVGPALGGVLAQALHWQAIFVAQVVVACAAAASAYLQPAVSVAAEPVPRQRRQAPAPAPMATEPAPPRQAPAPPGASAPATLAARFAALGLVSGALSAVLFGLVLLIVAGWEVSPLRAAAAVSVLALGALAGARLDGPAQVRAASGCALVGAGVLALAWIPQPRLVWTLTPQLLAGLGAGLALRALGGELLAQRTEAQAARLLCVRHAAIALVLVALAPVISTALNASTRRAELQGIALVLDAKLAPADKLRLAPALFSAVRSQAPRASLRAAFAAHRGQLHGAELVAYDQLDSRAQQLVLETVKGALDPAFLITGALALLAALLLAREAIRAGGGTRALAAALALAGCLAVAYAVAERQLAPAPVMLADPCAGGPLPNSGGISGFLQDRALQLLDLAACQLHTGREELVLALASPAEAKRFAAAHDGVNPRTLLGSLAGLLGL
ncbi:MAG: MFS transporter [Solirubrobacteraceae bacterium]